MVDPRMGGSAAAAEGRKAPSAMAAARDALKIAGKPCLKRVCMCLAGAGAQIWGLPALRAQAVGHVSLAGARDVQAVLPAALSSEAQTALVQSGHMMGALA